MQWVFTILQVQLNYSQFIQLAGAFLRQTFAPIATFFFTISSAIGGFMSANLRFCARYFKA